MFKVGDQVKCIRANGVQRLLTEGKAYMVLCADSSFLQIQSDRGSLTRFYHDRFELADPLASLSDKELAEEYRKLQDKKKDAYDELIKRSCQIYLKGVKTAYCPSREDIVIKKVEVEEL